ncbi:MAG: hypothetical protein J5634_02385 [Bacilli bacterium]|nr:hypothetical protein [Bacilli bacterium]
MKNKFIIVSFLIIIYITFFFVPFKELMIRLHVINYYPSDNWEVVKKSNDKIYDKVMTLEAFVKNRYNNYFPFYNKINEVYYGSIINIDKTYLNDIYLKDNIDDERIFYNKNNDFFYVVNKYSDDELNKRLNEQVIFYNDIKEKYPDVWLGLYIPLRYESFSFMNINKLNDLVNLFISKINKDIKYDLFDVDNISDYLKYYYKTDHHYNSYGAEIAYNDILKMLDIEDSLEFNHKNVFTPYYGSMAKSVLLKKQSDTLTAIDYDNKLNVNITDENFKPLEKRDRSNPFYDYYVGYFNGMYDEIIYDSGNNSGRNLLLIGDSYSWQIDYLLANNFDKTYVVNTKYGKWTTNDLVLKDYIKENNITHILFLREAKNLIFDADNFKLDKKVIR